MSQVTYPNFGSRDSVPSQFTECTVTVPATNVHVEPKESAPLETQVLLGQRIEVKLTSRDCEWAPCRTVYGVEGYLKRAHVSHALTRPTYRVVRPTLVYRSRDTKSPAMARLYTNSLLSLRYGQGLEEFIAFEDGWVLSEDLMVIGQKVTDPISAAAEKVGTPYLWGGNTDDALDCSGLIKLAFDSLHEKLPHSAAQIAEVLPGQRLDPTRHLGHLRRGDLVGWPDHIGIMQDRQHLIHATRRRHRVVIEDLTLVLHERKKRDNPPPTTIVRPSLIRT